MKYIVNTPSTSFEGKRAAVDFRKGTTGEIELTDKQVQVFKELGYTVVEVKAEVKPTKRTTKKSGE